MMRGMTLSIEDPPDLNLSTLDQVLQYLTLHIYVAHYVCLLKVLVQDDALKPHFVFVITFLSVVMTLVTSDQIEENQT